MDWLKPIVEKLSINRLFLAIAIVCFIYWYKTSHELALYSCIALTLYLLFTWLNSSYKFFRNVSANNRYEEERKREKEIRLKQEHDKIDLWFESLTANQVNYLLCLLRLPSSKTGDNYRIGDPHLVVNEGECIFPIENTNIPIDSFSGIPVIRTTYGSLEKPVHYIHPHLYNILIEYKKTH